MHDTVTTELHEALKTTKISVDAIISLMAADPEAIKRKDGEGKLPLHIFCSNRMSTSILKGIESIIPILVEALPEAREIAYRQFEYEIGGGKFKTYLPYQVPLFKEPDSVFILLKQPYGNG